MSFIAVIDYQMGNLLNVSKALNAAGAEVRIATTPQEVQRAAGLVLPGVGNFGEAMIHLKNRGFISLIQNWIQDDKPFLGICLGMQLLLESSEEAPGVDGLGIFPGTVQRFPSGKEKVPHMGWNTIEFRQNNPFFDGLNGNPAFYFVHSYYVNASGQPFTAAVSDYILPFTAAVSQGNLIATQFHPEKSQDAGLQLLRNFVRKTQSVKEI